MNVLVSLLSVTSIVYGIAIFIGLTVMFVKLVTFHWFSLAVDVAVFWLVFTLHGGSMSGAFAATIAALLSGMFFPLLVRVAFRRR